MLIGIVFKYIPSHSKNTFISFSRFAPVRPVGSNLSCGALSPTDMPWWQQTAARQLLFKPYGILASAISKSVSACACVWLPERACVCVSRPSMADYATKGKSGNKAMRSAGRYILYRWVPLCLYGLTTRSAKCMCVVWVFVYVCTCVCVWAS